MTEIEKYFRATELGVHFIDYTPAMSTVADHFFQMEAVGGAKDPFLEGYTSLGFLAGQTE